MHQPVTKTWDIFCRVIDNYGDIGVCWRLARQLASEYHQGVRLWVDDLNALVRLWPDTLHLPRQTLAGVDVREWPNNFPPGITTADVVVEAFACDIPPSYLQAMTQRKHSGEAPFWINLEYLSAEQWVEDCHAMVSIHPSTGLRKTFFFPGFTAKTGGLLREQDLLERRDSFDKTLFLKEIGVDAAPRVMLVSLFAYENQAVQSLITAWAKADQPIHCLVPQGKILDSINRHLSSPIYTGDVYKEGNLCLQPIPFLTQTRYDQLLWACDVNFVRGEDSFVRAQWAAKPFVWHIYPQEEQAHLVKLEAFMDLLLAGATPPVAGCLKTFWMGWNQATDICEAWNQLAKHLPAWQNLTHRWQEELAARAHLAQQLMALAAPAMLEKSTTEKPQSPV